MRTEALLAGWGTSWLAGLAGLDQVLDVLDDPDTVPSRAQRVSGLDAASAGMSLPAALVALRQQGARSLRVVLAVPGDPRGLPGTDPFTGRALDAGAGVIVSGPAPWGLVATGSTWSAYPTRPWRSGVLPGVHDAEQELRAAVAETTDALLGLDADPGSPEVRVDVDIDTTLRRTATAQCLLPPGVPPPVRSLFDLARRVAAIAAVAARTPTAPTGVRAMTQRAAALRRLSAAARLAEMAVWNSPAELLEQTVGPLRPDPARVFQNGTEDTPGIGG